MKAFEWWLPGMVLLAWAIYCRVARGFPLPIIVFEVILAVLMILGGVVLQYIRKRSVAADPKGHPKSGKASHD